MLTKKQQNYFFELFRNAFYFDVKATIEEIYKDIEKDEIRQIRDQLLIEAEKRAIKNAKKAVRKIKNKSIDQLLKLFSDDSRPNNEKFGEDLLNEIEKDLKEN